MPSIGSRLGRLSQTSPAPTQRADEPDEPTLGSTLDRNRPTTGSDSRPSAPASALGSSLYRGRDTAAVAANPEEGARDTAAIAANLEEGARVMQLAVEGNVFPTYEAAPQQVKQIVQTAAILYQYGLENDDQEMVDYARTVRTQASEVVPMDVQEQYGWLEIPEIEDERNFLGKMRDTALNAAFGDHPIGRFTSKAFEIADRPSQGVLTMLALFNADDEDRSGQGLAALGRGLTFQEQPDDNYGVGIDNDQDGTINFREAFGRDADAGGRLAGLFDTVGVALLDPTTYLGVGAAQRAKTSLSAVAAEMGEDVATAVSRQGIGILDTVAQQRIRDRISRELAEAAARRGTRPVRDRIFGAGQETADAAMDRLSRPTGTLRIGGANVRSPIDPIVDRIPGRRQVGGVRRGAGPLDNIDRADAIPDPVLSARNTALEKQLPGIGIERPGEGLLTQVEELDGIGRVVGVRDEIGDMVGHLVYDADGNTIDGLFINPKHRGQGVSELLYDGLADTIGGPEAIARISREGAAGLTESGEGALRSYLRKKGVDVEGVVEATGVRPSVPQRLRATAEAPGSSLQRSAARAVTAPGRTLDALRPRIDISRELGEHAERVFDRARVRRGSQATNEINDSFRRMSAHQRAAFKAVGEDEADRLVREALEAVGEGPGLTDLDTALRRADELRDTMPEVADYMESVARVRESIDQAAARAGLDPDQFRSGYFPRILTEEGREVVTQQPAETQRVLGLDANKLRGKESRFHHPRTYRPDLSLDDANRQLAKDLKLPPGQQDVKIFEDSVLGAFATRGDAAFRAAADMDMLTSLEREFIGDGAERSAMIVRKPGTAADDWAPPRGYREVADVEGGFYAPRQIADEIEEMRGFITNNVKLQKMSEFFNNWSRTWGAWATAPLHKGTGFHARNGFSNVILNALAGVTDPTHYTRAGRLQRTIHRVYDSMMETGSSFDDAMKKLDVGESDRALIHSLRDESIIDHGWFDEISEETMRPRERGVLGTRKYDNSWDFLQNNAVVRSGRAVGGAIEHNARVAHFIAKLDAPGGTVESAARSVRKYLFDYTDLTGVERSLRNASRFYTFMRKNTAVQLYALAHNPGRVLALERATKDGLSSTLGIDQGMIRPDYSEERGDMLDVGSILGDPGRIAGGLESPFGAALEALRPLGELAGLATGDSTGDDLLRSLVDMTSGGQAAFIDAVYQELTDQHLAFDRELLDEEKGAEGTARRWLDAIVGPAWSSFDTAVERITNGEGVGAIGNQASASNEEFGPELFVLANILGLNQAVLRTEDREELDYVYTLAGELDNMLKDMRADGKPVPTIEQLRQAGILPELPDTPTRAQSVIIQEDIDELEATGLDSSALRTRLSDALLDEQESYTEIGEDGTYTTRPQRASQLARDLGIFVLGDDGQPKLDDEGNPIPSLRREAQVAWNREHPDQPFTDDEGNAYDYYDLSVTWPAASTADVRRWLQEQGATKDGEPITSSTYINDQMKKLYNEQNPEDPYISRDDMLRQGIRPVSGVYIHDDGTEIWPEGMSADNWSITGSESVRGSTALQEDDPFQGSSLLRGAN